MGLEPLVEIHGPEDAAKARRIAPNLVGINSRDLKSFKIDKGYPAKIRPLIDWDARCIFESGITYGEDALFARSAGFQGILVGETVVRNPGLIPELTAAFGVEGKWVEERRFWGRLFGKWGERLEATDRTGVSPLVKVCGITSVKDAVKAEELGADLLGFVFADSPRRTKPDLPREVKNLSCLKVGVVVVQAGERTLSPEIRRLLDDTSLDAVQLHGDESPEICGDLGFPYYKAVRIGSPEDLERARSYRAPRSLLDAAMPGKRGGSGVPIDKKLLAKNEGRNDLWLAGGIGIDTVEEILRTYTPELIDLSSGLEGAPGIKDHKKMDDFFERIRLLEAEGVFHHG
jgi:indole-3-glycerol phosphate synthase/phosphoribosylanthranilate isomerase